MGKRRRRGSDGLRCETCGQGCADELALLKHREAKHLQRACAYCPSRFATIEELMGHYKADHPNGDPRKPRPKLVLTSSHCKFCSQLHDSRTMYKFDWERREIVKCRCCQECDRDRRLVERNPGPPSLPDQQINWNRAEPGVRYKCFLCGVSFDHPLVARSHFTRCHNFPKDIELVAHVSDDEGEGGSGEERILQPQASSLDLVVDGVEEEEEEEVEIAVTDASAVTDATTSSPEAKRPARSDYANSLFVSRNSRPRTQRAPRAAVAHHQAAIHYQIRAPSVELAERDDSHRYDFEEDEEESLIVTASPIQLLPQEYAEEVTVVADY